jgi:hypothetical protein
MHSVRFRSKSPARTIRNILLGARGFFLTTAMLALGDYYLSLATSGAYVTIGSEVAFNGVYFSTILLSLLVASILSLAESLQTKKPPPNLRMDLYWTVAGVGLAVLYRMATILVSLPLRD